MFSLNIAAVVVAVAGITVAQESHTVTVRCHHKIPCSGQTSTYFSLPNIYPRTILSCYDIARQRSLRLLYSFTTTVVLETPSSFTKTTPPLGARLLSKDLSMVVLPGFQAFPALTA